MVDNHLDNKNIVLTPEQTAGIEEYQVKLATLLSETVNATKILKGIKMETDRAVKEKAYQEEMLTDLTPKVVEKKSQIDGYNEEINKATSTLSKLLDEIKSKTAEQLEKDTLFKEREDKISAKELQLSNQGSAISKEKILLNNDKVDFNAKVAKLKEVISTF